MIPMSLNDGTFNIGSGIGTYNNYGEWLKRVCRMHNYKKRGDIGAKIFIESSIKEILIYAKRPLIFEFQIDPHKSDESIKSSFPGHIGNLVYIPSDTDSNNLSKGRYYCIQSFVYSYYPIQKEISLDEFIRYIMIYIYKFNLNDDDTDLFGLYDIKYINKSDYYEVTWNSPVDYDLDKIYGKLKDPNITIKIIDNYEIIYSKLIYILCTMFILLKIVIGY
jgi:hypothetical protein